MPEHLNYCLGLDISSSVCGYCVLCPQDSSIIRLGYEIIKDKGDIIQRTEYLRKVLESLCQEYNISTIGLENYLESYSRGMTNTKTIITLAQINILCQYMIRTTLPNVILMPLNVRSARKSVVGKIVGKNQKLQVREWFLKTISWQFETKKSGKIIDEAGDMIDAYVIAKATSQLI